MKEHLTLLPLESYASRYTEYLADIEFKAFGKHFRVAQHQVCEGAAEIVTGAVLDATTRTMVAMEQMSELLSLPVDDFGKIYFSDFYHTGLDALAYSQKRFKAFAFCWAQTWDVHDFTYRQHLRWMRHWENMALNVYTGVFVASPLLKELIMAATPQMAATVHAVGLPFDSKHVRSLRKAENDCFSEGWDVVYASRWDEEKNPSFFLKVVKQNPKLRFVVCTGNPQLKGTALDAIAEAEHLEKEGRLQIFRGLTKSQYFTVLHSSKVSFNCARQDWVSFTLLEALTFGCWPVYPSVRSFPDALNYNLEGLYIPDSITDASRLINQALQAIARKEQFRDTAKILNYHDNTLNRIAEIIKTCP